MTNRALIFDCDGVLVNSEVIAIDAERKLLAEHGLRYEFSDYVSRFSGLSEDDYYKSLDDDFVQSGHAGLPQYFIARLQEEMHRRFETELAPVDGIQEFLTAFEGARGVASSSGLDLLHKKLRATGLHRHFGPHIYSAEHVQRGKPHPDLFLFTAEKLNHAPGDCVVIEDSVNGVRAGRAAGMTVWGFTGGGHADDGLGSRLEDAGADRVFDDFPAMARFSF